MSGPIPSELKALSPFLTRAKELATAEPVIAYWCTYYALQQAIEIESKDADSNAYLLSLMDKLEQMKEELKGRDTVTDDAAASAFVENFAVKVFVQADNEDRQGKATRLTAKKFLAAANFLEVLGVFGEMNPDIADKIKYSKWKASDIAKAIREGRKPTPGPAGGLNEDDQALESAEVTGEEAKELSKELAALGTDDERSKAIVGQGAPAENTRSAAQTAASPQQEDLSYPFPQVPASAPSSAPLPSPGPIPEQYETSSADLAAGADNVATEVGDVPSLTTTPKPPANLPTPSAPETHQTAELAPPAVTSSSAAGFASAVFPSAPGFSAAPPMPPPPTVPSVSSPAPTQSRLVPTPSAPPSVPATSGSQSEMLDPMIVTTIQKHAKWAISALNYDDYDTARKELRAALAMLGG